MVENTAEKAIAHVKQHANASWATPHYLEQHLRSVKLIAGKCAEAFDSQEWAEAAGQLHDLGKYRTVFLNYIKYKSGYDRSTAHMEHFDGKVTHSTAGALHAIDSLGGLGYVLAYMITGHHGGLPNGIGDNSSLIMRLEHGKQEYKEALETDIPADILNVDKDLMPPMWVHDEKHIHIWIRLIFSCLVDADYLDTEAYMSPDRSLKRPKDVAIQDVYGHYLEKLDVMLQTADDTKVNSIRATILNQCLKASGDNPGLFSLTVPTGGGKTLSSLAFALKHAHKYGKRRVIYSIPFTSIIEQNADVFRSFLKDEWVLEHHSNLDPTKETPLNRLASENWDQPLVVTTNVQLFESLFAYKPSRCRKLHNITNSVIIVDEAQQIPRDFHRPITDMMQHLSDHYGVTWVLCTATQPVLDNDTDAFGRVIMPGLKDVREIIEEPEALAQDLKRVTIEFPESDRLLSWEEIARGLRFEPSILVVVNTKRDAVSLYEALPDDGHSLFLSANMCQKQRQSVLKEVRDRLKARREGDKRPLRLISTQLIEAGVDLDFPVVYRAMAGLDSIGQAAGRCNREGKLDDHGRVVVFHPPTLPPEGFLRQSASVTNMLLKAGLLEDPLSGESFKAYFSELNQLGDRDAYDICRKLTATSTEDMPISIQFRDAGNDFSLIDQNSVSVLLPYLSNASDKTGVFAILDQLAQDPKDRAIKRQLQPYSVSMPRKRFEQLLERRGLNDNNEHWVVKPEFCHPVFGLDVR